MCALQSIEVPNRRFREKKTMRYNKGRSFILPGGHAMDLQLRATAEMTARLLLQTFRAEHGDEDFAPLDAIVPWLGLHMETFHAADYPPGTFGFTDADEDEHLIWLCRGLAEAFRRFTLAHELGHALLHCRSTPRIQELLGTYTAQTSWPVSEPSRLDPCSETDVQENMLDQEQFEAALGIGHSYDPRSERELAGRAGSHYWHLRMPGRPGKLELNEWQNRVWVKVHPLREGTWAADLAHELAALSRTSVAMAALMIAVAAPAGAPYWGLTARPRGRSLGGRGVAAGGAGAPGAGQRSAARAQSPRPGNHLRADATSCWPHARRPSV